VLILYLGLLALTVFGFVKVPSGFIPAQDQGYLIVIVQLPEGASLTRSDKVVRKITDLAREVEGVTSVVAFAGWSLPLSIILVVPMCVLAALAGVWLRYFGRGPIVTLPENRCFPS
jgi:multidrug efflux pump subunit AcrB